MKGSTIAVLAALALTTGCGNMVSTEANDRAKLAAYAAQESVPTTAPSDLAAGVTLSADHQSLQITNYSDVALTNVDVWVNKTYVQHVDLIDPHSIKQLTLNRFYSKDGTYFGQDTTSRVQEVQISSGDKVYSLLGPVNE